MLQKICVSIDWTPNFALNFARAPKKKRVYFPDMIASLDVSSSLFFGSDHRGLSLKTLLIEHARMRNCAVVDHGTITRESCDAGDFAQRVVADLREHPAHIGILICGTGQAMAMTANRHRHIRAALCVNTTMVRLARAHNDANILVLGAEIIGPELARDCLDAFLTTPFANEERFVARRDKLDRLGRV